MKFTKPENIGDLSLDELKELRSTALAELTELVGLSNDDITDEQLADMEALSAFDTEVGGLVQQAEAAVVARHEKIEAMRAQAEASSAADTDAPIDEAAEPAVDEETPADEPAVDEVVAEDPAEEPVVDELPADPFLEDPLEGETAAIEPIEGSEIIEEMEPVTASAVQKAAGRGATVVIPSEEEQNRTPAFSLVASAEANGVIASGGEFESMRQVAQAFASRSRAYEGRSGIGHERFGVAKLKRVRGDDRLRITEQMGEAEVEAVFALAGNESRLSQGNLVAAGGWAAPSELFYDFCEFVQPVNTYSLPEVTWARGGIRWTRGPSFADFYPTFGFHQTEAQAIAGTVKTFNEITLPTWEEARLEVQGYGFRFPILTNVTWPELIQRYLEMGLAAHALKMDAWKLAKVQSLLGTAVVAPVVSSGITDVLAGLELHAFKIREINGLEPDATLEVILPTWALAVFRAELSNRPGDVEFLSITDAEITGWFSARNLAVQFVRMYQNIGTTGTAWPTTLEAMIYPAGAFVAGVNDVIDLDTVYDKPSLEVNMYTAAFFEEAIQVINQCWTGKRITFPIDNFEGRTGAADLGAVAA